MVRFGTFELDEEAGQLRRNGTPLRLPPQPFRLLVLLVSRPGELITREEIRQQLWGNDTYVDFDQGVNFCIKQVRSALHDDADRPLYVETVPRRGYRFIAPIERPGTSKPQPPARPSGMDSKLQRALWANIAELRLAETTRRRRRLIVIAAAVGVTIFAIVFLVLR
ncbi:MAG TPA: winged helix-turn-helix domain-containing protein [Vicinamibacterales bacterium]